MNVSFTKNGKNIYLLPDDINDFYNNLKEIGSFCITVLYNDGSFDSHITNSSKIKNSNDLENNIKTSSILKRSENPRFDDINYVIVSCKKYKD